MHLMNWGLKPQGRKSITCLVALIMLLGILGLGSPGTAQAKTDSSAPAESLVVNILNPDGTTTLVHDYSYAELVSLEETEYYATIDSMPIGVGTKAKGVKINTLINDAKQYNSNIKWESGQRLVFYVTDAPVAYQPAFYTYDNLYGQNRYYYPELVETYNPDNPTAVSLNNAVLVEPMLASSSYQARSATDTILKSTENPVTMDGTESFRFCMGITEAEATTPGVSTTNRYARWVYRVDVGPLASPKLYADTTDNAVGQPIELIFTDNPAWREAITQVKVNNNVLESNKYQIEAKKLTINSDVFTQAGDYTITITATGYSDATVTQSIYNAYETTAMTIKVDNGNPITLTAEQIKEMNSNNQLRHYSYYKDGQMNYYTGLGAPLAAILSQYAGVNSSDIHSIIIKASDSYYLNLTDPQNELFNTRYYYPAVGEEVQVDTIIATAAQGYVTSDPAQLDTMHTMRLMVGQTSANERTNFRMVKWVNEIDITTTAATNVPVSGVSLNKIKAALAINSSEQLTVTVTPPNATDQIVTWTSDNEAAASVDNTGKVTAVGVGQAVITATTKDGSFTASCTVTVAAKPQYKLTPAEDATYTIGATADGIPTLTVNQGQSGLKYFSISVATEVPHAGDETVIFTHWRNGSELQLNATVADFDVVKIAKAGFNVQPGDIIKVYIVDDLTNDENTNPVILQ